MLALRTVQRGRRHRGRAHRGRCRAVPCSPRGRAHPGAVLTGGRAMPCSPRGYARPRAVLTVGGAVPCSLAGSAHPGAVLTRGRAVLTGGRALPQGRAHPGPCRAYPGHGPNSPPPLPARSGEAGVPLLHPPGLRQGAALRGTETLECARCGGDSTGTALPPRPARLGQPRGAALCVQRCGAAVPLPQGCLWSARSYP